MAALHGLNQSPATHHMTFCYSDSYLREAVIFSTGVGMLRSCRGHME